MESLHENNEEQPRRRKLRLITAESTVTQFSHEAEQFLLASCFVDSAQVVALCLAARLPAAAFHDSRHQVVYEKIVALHRSGFPVAPEVVWEELKTASETDNAGGLAYFAELTGCSTTTLQADYFVKKVRDLFLVREAIRHGLRLIEECQEWNGEPLHEFFARYASKWQKASAWAQGRALGAMREVAEAASANAREAIAGKVDKSRWLYTGMAHVDEKLTPFDVNSEDWYVVIAGLRSQGKSALARQIAVHNWSKGKRGIIFTLETSSRGWLQRAAGVYARVDMRNLASEMPEKISRFEKRLAEQEAWVEERLWIYDDIFTIDEIELKVREIDRLLRDREIERGVPADEARGLDFAVVDYLQLVQTKKRCRSREEEVADVSRRLKMCFKGANITGFALAQLSRKAADEKRAPALSDLRESGSIEQDADRVDALELLPEDRAGQEQDAGTPTPLMKVWQLKNRNGPTGWVEVLMWKKWTYFEDAPHRGDVRPGQPKPDSGYRRNG